MNIDTQRMHDFINAFLLDRKARNLAPGTLHYYQEKLHHFESFCNKHPSEITPSDLRLFLLHLQENHTSGGIHCIFRAVRAFLLWYEMEFEPPNWKNPLHKIKSPKQTLEPLNAVSLEDVAALLKVSDIRDYCLLICLLDVGVRSNELLNMNRDDFDPLLGQILIRKSKNRKPRVCFLGEKSRRALRKYLKTRTDNHPALWLSEIGTRLTYDGLRGVITRRAKDAHISPPPLHAFRRAFCINMLRSNCDLISLSNLAGWSSLSVATRYLKQSGEDVRLAHRQGGVDNWL